MTISSYFSGTSFGAEAAANMDDMYGRHHHTQSTETLHHATPSSEGRASQTQLNPAAETYRHLDSSLNEAGHHTNTSIDLEENILAQHEHPSQSDAVTPNPLAEQSPEHLWRSIQFDQNNIQACLTNLASFATKSLGNMEILFGLAGTREETLEKQLKKLGEESQPKGRRISC